MKLQLSLATLMLAAWTSVASAQLPAAVGETPVPSLAPMLKRVSPAVVNIATRGHVGEDDDVLVSGFVTRGTGQKRVLVRAVGPTLRTEFNVPSTLTNPRITLYSADRGNSVVGTNAVWGGTPVATAAFAQVGAFPLPQTSADAVLLATLDIGGYSASVSAPRGEQGVALLEVYDADSGSPTAEIINISTRALVGAEAADVLIAGFVISGTTSGMFSNVTDVMNASELAYYGLTGTQYTTFIDGQEFWVAQGSTYLVAIPEPKTAFLGGLGLLMLLRRRRSA